MKHVTYVIKGRIRTLCSSLAYIIAWFLYLFFRYVSINLKILLQSFFLFVHKINKDRDHTILREALEQA